jgi:hypothetical protein
MITMALQINVAHFHLVRKSFPCGAKPSGIAYVVKVLSTGVNRNI